MCHSFSVNLNSHLHPVLDVLFIIRVVGTVCTWDKLIRAVQPSLICTFLKEHCIGGRIISKAHSGFGVEEAVYNERSQVTAKKM